MELFVFTDAVRKSRCYSVYPICRYVRQFVRSITQKRMISLSSNLGYPRSDIVFKSKGQRSRSQGHKVQKKIILKAIEWPACVCTYRVRCAHHKLYLLLI